MALPCGEWLPTSRHWHRLANLHWLSTSAVVCWTHDAAALSWSIRLGHFAPQKARSGLNPAFLAPPCMLKQHMPPKPARKYERHMATALFSRHAVSNSVRPVQDLPTVDLTIFTARTARIAPNTCLKFAVTCSNIMAIRAAKDTSPFKNLTGAVRLYQGYTAMAIE